MSMNGPFDLSLLDHIDLGNMYGTEDQIAESKLKKREAIEVLDSYGVYEDIYEEEAETEQIKIIRARWGRQQKAMHEREEVPLSSSRKSAASAPRKRGKRSSRDRARSRQGRQSR